MHHSISRLFAPRYVSQSVCRSNGETNRVVVAMIKKLSERVALGGIGGFSFLSRSQSFSPSNGWSFVPPDCIVGIRLPRGSDNLSGRCQRNDGVKLLRMSAG